MRNITRVLICMSVLLPCQACMATSGATTQAKSVVPVFEQQAQVRSALDKLIDACQSKNLRLLMSQFSEGYTGDADNLETTVRNDFSQFNNISIRYTVNNITPDANAEKVAMGVTFTRTHQVVKTGIVKTVTGQTELIFKKEDGEYRLYNMKKPLLFGLSE